MDMHFDEEEVTVTCIGGCGKRRTQHVDDDEYCCRRCAYQGIDG